MNTKYAIQLISKMSGEAAWLRTSYATREAAIQYVEREIYLRCNYIEIHSVPESWQWINRKLGFQEMKGVGVA